MQLSLLAPCSSLSCWLMFSVLSPWLSLSESDSESDLLLSSCCLASEMQVVTKTLRFRIESRRLEHVLCLMKEYLNEILKNHL